MRGVGVRSLSRAKVHAVSAWSAPVWDAAQIIVLIVAIMVACGASSAHAQVFGGTDTARPWIGPHQVWTGIDTIDDVWLFYSGVTIAPFSDTMHSDGWRLRVAGGYGSYQYQLKQCARLPDGTTTCREPKFRAITNFFEGLVGYHIKTGHLTAKLFAGVISIDHKLPVPSAQIEVEGNEIGPKLATELWLDIGDAGWTSLDLSATTAHGTAGARWRTGWRLANNLSVGPEFRFDRNDGGKGYRAGLFANHAIEDWELSLAAGVGSDAFQATSDELQPYATLQLMKDF